MALAAGPGPLRRAAHALRTAGPRMGPRELGTTALPRDRPEDGTSGRRRALGSPVSRIEALRRRSLGPGRSREGPRHHPLAGHGKEPAYRLIPHPASGRGETVAKALSKPAIFPRNGTSRD